MNRRPPVSTLFPYTTLSRSLAGRALLEHWHEPVFFVDRSLEVLFANRQARAWMTNDGSVTEDRKSTRLNSSHANISYAVFCLKKKHYMTSSCISNFDRSQLC